VPVQRLRLLEELHRTKTAEVLNDWRETRDIADAVNIPGATVRLLLEDMMIVGILNRQRGDSDGGRPPYSWQLAADVCEWIAAAEVFVV
jgi:predicted transcriptional regulator